MQLLHSQIHWYWTIERANKCECRSTSRLHSRRWPYPASYIDIFEMEIKQVVYHISLSVMCTLQPVKILKYFCTNTYTGLHFSHLHTNRTKICFNWAEFSIQHVAIRYRWSIVVSNFIGCSLDCSKKYDYIMHHSHNMRMTVKSYSRCTCTVTERSMNEAEKYYNYWFIVINLNVSAFFRDKRHAMTTRNKKAHIKMSIKRFNILPQRCERAPT